MPQQVLNNARFLSRVSLLPNSVQSILDVFVIQGLITSSDADSLKQRYKTNREIEDYLVGNRIVTHETINKAYSILLKLPYVSLTNVKIPPEVLAIIPRRLAEKYGIVAFSRKVDSVLVAVARPSNLTVTFSSGLEKLLQEKNLKVELYITGPKDFDEAMKQYNQTGGKNLLLETGSMPAVYLRNQDIPGSLLGKFPLDFIENFRAVVFYLRDEGSYAVALEQPDDPATRSAIDQIAKLNNITFQLFATSKEDIDYAISIYKKKILEQEKTKSAPPVLERPVPKAARPEQKPPSKSGGRDNDVITLSSLFSSFLGGGRKGAGNGRQAPVVTIDEYKSASDQAKQPTKEIKLDENQGVETQASEQASESGQDDEASKTDQQQKPDEVQANKEEGKDQDQKSTLIVRASKNESGPAEKRGEEEESDEIKGGEELDGDKIGRLLDKEIKTSQDLTAVLKENYIPKIVAAVIDYALNSRASDIHIEPGAKKLRIRYRIDGILRDIVMLSLKFHPPIISRIKILSKMKLDETRIPQDGRFDLPFKEREVDVRVSCLPTVHGEKVMMRILDKSQDILSLEDLGMVGRAFDLTIEAIKKSYGIILSTGPTGSGKSTTLYAAISRLSSASINIVTLEDPVEYEIPGVNQCQVKPTIGFTFADGLRSVLRQDPNVVMVGEIRDGETASMATHAALAGHLVLSTLHTNDAASALPRLIDMGIEPFLITSSIDLVIAQRLVRRICPRCKKESKMPDSLIEEIKKELASISKENLVDLKRAEKPLKFYHGTGCSDCSQGFKGRVGIFEVIRMTGEIEELSVARRPANEIKAAAIKDGMITIKQDGILKAMEGLTTLDEVFQAATS